MSEEKAKILELSDEQIDAVLELVDRELASAKLLVDTAARLRAAKATGSSTARPTPGERPQERRP